MSRSKSDDKTSRDPENLLDGFDVVFENPGSEITTNFMDNFLNRPHRVVFGLSSAHFAAAQGSDFNHTNVCQ
jgi:hypothetical protein